MYSIVTISQFGNGSAFNNLCRSTTAVLHVGNLKKQTFLSQLFLQSASRVV